MRDIKNYIATAIYLCPDCCINIVAISCMIVISACAGTLAGAITTVGVGLATIVYNAKVIYHCVRAMDHSEKE